MPHLKDKSLPRQYRSCEIVRREQTQEQRDAGEPALYEVTVSTETPVERWFGTEVLSHEKKSIDMSRLKRGAAVLIDHYSDQVGVVERAWVDEESRKLKAEIRFSRSVRGQEVERDVADGVRQNISVGYFVKAAKLTETRDDGQEVWTVTRWQPAEVSIVSVPADVNAGIGRGVPASASNWLTSITGGNTFSTSGGTVGSNAYPTATFVRFAEEYPVEIETDGEPVATREEPMADEIKDKTPAPVAPTAAEITSGEQRRAEDIRGICKTAGVEHFAASFIGSTLSVPEIAARVQEARKTVGSAQPANEALAKTVGPDLKRYSVVRAIRQSVMEKEGVGKFDGIEAEVHQEMDRILPPGLKRNGGFLVPMGWAQRTTLDTLTPTKGTETVFEEAGSLIELLRPRSILVESGARTLSGLSGPISFPKQTAGSTVQWVAEGVTQTFDSDPSLGLALLSPKNIQGNIPFTRQLMMESSIGIEAWVRSELEISHGLAFDRAGLHGKGNSGQPQGVYVAVGVGTSTGTNTPATDFNATNGMQHLVVEFVGAVSAANADLGTMGWITTPQMAALLGSKVKFTNTGETFWQGPLRSGNMVGYSARSSTQVSSTLDANGVDGLGTSHGLVFGNWADMILASFGAMELIVDPYSRKRAGIIEVTSYSQGDVLVRHGQSFVKGLVYKPS